MHAAENKVQEKPVQIFPKKPVETFPKKPVEIFPKKRLHDPFKDDEEKEKYYAVQDKRIRLAEMVDIKAAEAKEYGSRDSDPSTTADEETVVVFHNVSDISTTYSDEATSDLGKSLEDFCEDEILGVNDEILAQKTDSEAESDDDEEGSDEEEECSEKSESDDSDSE
ncbi:uncharacterized protein LOC113350715 [Papaver somniferum]|uniref:uncharacterized protein LOC113350715 n=1 Tax=Papaver somniferum TaxID=3469 RepID=UPI000E6F7057|nr:uncharacterized protein LOC113350715 [Papaver somniferum]